MDMILRRIADIFEESSYQTERLSDTSVAIHCNMSRVLVVTVEMRSYAGYVVLIREFNSPMYSRIEINEGALESLISNGDIVKYIVAIYNDKMALKPLTKGGEAE